MEKTIANIKRKTEKAGAKVKAMYNKEMSSLEETNRDLQKKLSRIKGVGQTAWKGLKKSVRG